MRRVFTFVLLALLPGIATIAQKPIEEKDFNRLVDYVNCRYANAYIQNAGRGNDAIAYQKYIKPKLEKCTLEEHLSYNELYKLLIDNSWGQTANSLVKSRKEKKLFSEVSDKPNNEKINYIIDLSNDFRKYIGDSIINVLNAELQKDYPIVNQLDSAIVEPHSETTNDDQVKKSFNIWLLIAILATNILWLILILFFSKDFIKRVTYKSRRLEKKFKLNTESEIPPGNTDNAQIKIFLEKIKNLEDKISEQNDAIARIQHNFSKHLIDGHPSSNSSKHQEEEITVFKYLKSEPGKIFRESQSAEGCFFRLRNERNETAQFEFCGDEKKAIAQRIFIDEISVIVSGKYANAHVKTVTMGDLRRNGEKWEVVNPIKIKIE